MFSHISFARDIVEKPIVKLVAFRDTVIHGLHARTQQSMIILPRTFLKLQLKTSVLKLLNVHVQSILDLCADQEQEL